MGSLLHGTRVFRCRPMHRSRWIVALSRALYMTTSAFSCVAGPLYRGVEVHEYGIGCTGLEEKTNRVTVECLVLPRTPSTFSNNPANRISTEAGLGPFTGAEGCSERC